MVASETTDIAITEQHRKKLQVLLISRGDEEENRRKSEAFGYPFPVLRQKSWEISKLYGMFATPIINYPEVAIMGVHKIEQRPVVLNGQIVIRDRMYLSLSFDHRVVDGVGAARFLATFKGLVEAPEPWAAP